MNSSPDLPISNAYTSRNSTGHNISSDLSLGLSLSGSSSHPHSQQTQAQSQHSSRPGAASANPPSSYSRQDSYRQDSFRSSDSGYQPSSNFGSAGGPQSSSTSKSYRMSDSHSMAQQPHYGGNGNGSYAPSTASSTPSRPPLHHAYSTSGASSPNVNRHSYTMGPGGGGAGSSLTQPPRPVRSGTLPVGEHPGASYSNGMSVAPLPQLSIPPVPAFPSPSTPSSAGISSNQPFVSTPTPLEQSLESKMSLGPTIPVQTDKELPNGPPTVRARSGTKGSSKDKKSMFGVLSGECTARACDR